MELIEVATFVVASAGAIGSLYNAFVIQRPWRQDYLREQDRLDD